MCQKPDREGGQLNILFLPSPFGRRAGDEGAKLRTNHFLRLICVTKVSTRKKSDCVQALTPTLSQREREKKAVGLPGF
jgi:hypothetical protein